MMIKTTMKRRKHKDKNENKMIKSRKLMLKWKDIKEWDDDDDDDDDDEDIEYANFESWKNWILNQF